MLAQRLVASALIILPIATKVAPAVADAPAALPGRALRTLRRSGSSRAPARGSPLAGTAAPVAAASVAVGPGDTLIGLARTHLGDAARWRELFELNRDREQARRRPSALAERAARRLGALDARSSAGRAPAAPNGARVVGAPPDGHGRARRQPVEPLRGPPRRGRAAHRRRRRVAAPRRRSSSPPTRTSSRTRT